MQIDKRNDSQQHQTNHHTDASSRADPAGGKYVVSHSISIAGHSKVVRQSSAHYHSQDSDGAVAVALPCQDELPQRAATQQD